MSHSRTKRTQVQKAEASAGSITQIGRDYTHTTNTRVSVWISFVMLLTLAAAASVGVRLFTEYLTVDIQTQGGADQIQEVD